MNRRRGDRSPVRSERGRRTTPSGRFRRRRRAARGRAETRSATAPFGRSDAALRGARTLLFFLVLATTSSLVSRSAGAVAPEGEDFDLAEVEALAQFFAEESVRRLRVPLGARLFLGGVSKQEELEKIRRNPPSADADGVVYPFGDSNPLSFVFDAERRTLTVWERMIKKRGSIGLWGLTGPEAAAALNAASSRRDRGGADFAYDPLRDALSFRLDYPRPPRDRERFYGEVDRLVETQLEWSQERFLKEMTAIVEARETPASATATSGGFRATMALRHFSAGPEDTGRWVWRYVQAWSRAAPGPAPRLVSDAEVAVDQPLHVFVHFEGASADAEGRARIDAHLRVIGPGDRLRLEQRDIGVFRGEAPPRGHLQFGDRGATISLGAEEPPGLYRFELEVCDRVADRCVSLVHPITLTAG